MINRYRFIFLTIIFFILIILTFCYSAAAFENLSSCMEQASYEYHVPYWIIYSVGKIESNLNPYALNIDGKSYFPPSFDDSLSIMAENRGKSIDIGIMQINNYWFARLHYPLYYGLFPCFNIVLGAWIISRKIKRYGLNWYGVSAYHSTDVPLNAEYSEKLYGELGKIR